jgi:CRISPR-associated endoribonuclease Cas6
MRITVELASEKGKLFFSYHYHEAIQGLIYSHLPCHAPSLHNQGFSYQNRNFKLFVFSRIQGRLGGNNAQGVLFCSPIQILISSPIDWILQELADTLMRGSSIRLENEWLAVDSIAVHVPILFTSQVEIGMLSPMTMYSTFAKPDGHKLTHYYSPYERDFSELISKNLQKKYELLYSKPNSGTIQITPLFKGNRERVVYCQ